MMTKKKNNNYLLSLLFAGSLLSPISYLQVKPAMATADQKESSTTEPSENNTLPPEHSTEAQTVRPLIKQISFTGNTAISSKILQQAISLKINDIADEHVIMDSMVKIAALYKEKNLKITIAPIIRKTAIGVVNIQFDIHEIPAKSEQ